jgi:SulP family sulfate permease
VLPFALGALRLGTLVRFIPVSIVTGFTNGIAVIILLQQMKDFFGLQIAKMPSNSPMQIRALAAASETSR